MTELDTISTNNVGSYCLIIERSDLLEFVIATIIAVAMAKPVINTTVMATMTNKTVV
jgi:hypothetical protein